MGALQFVGDIAARDSHRDTNNHHVADRLRVANDDRVVFAPAGQYVDGAISVLSGYLNRGEPALFSSGRQIGRVLGKRVDRLSFPVSGLRLSAFGNNDTG